MWCQSLIIFCYFAVKCDCFSATLFLQPVNKKRNSHRPSTISTKINLMQDHQGTAQTILVGTNNDYVTRLATSEDVLSIVSCTNDAYVADTFFKKAEYHDRFTANDVMGMMSSPNSAFIVATRCSDPDNLVCGSLYLQWECKQAESKFGGPKIIGKFSAVAVSCSSQRKGVGHLLIQSAEKAVVQVANDERDRIPKVLAINGNDIESRVSAEITMGVINLREDLFPWYQAQGFTIEEQMPWDAELSRIVSEGYEHVGLIRMRKTLM
jgi:hypothetical protein